MEKITFLIEFNELDRRNRRKIFIAKYCQMSLFGPQRTSKLLLLNSFLTLLLRLDQFLHFNVFWQPTMNSPKNCRFFRENLWISMLEPGICLFVQWFFLLLVYCFLCMNQILTLPDFHVFHKNDMHPHSTDCMSNSAVFCPTSHTWRM